MANKVVLMHAGMHEGVKG